MLHNLLPRATNEDGMSPWEALHGTKPDFSNVRVWGCLSYCTLRNEHDRDNRMSPTGVKAVHLGCDERRRGWVVYIPSLNRITSSRDIVFNEEKFLRFDKHGHRLDRRTIFANGARIIAGLRRIGIASVSTRCRCACNAVVMSTFASCVKSDRGSILEAESTTACHYTCERWNASIGKYSPNCWC